MLLQISGGLGILETFLHLGTFVFLGGSLDFFDVLLELPGIVEHASRSA